MLKTPVEEFDFPESSSVQSGSQKDQTLPYSIQYYLILITQCCVLAQFLYYLAEKLDQ